MAKKYSESDIKRQLAARQGRNARGHFMSLKQEQKLSAVRASKVGTAQSLPFEETPATEAESTQQIENQIGIIEALIQQRKEMGFGDSSELENLVLGGKDKRGVRSILEQYKKDLDTKDPASIAAGVMLEEAAKLSEDSLSASQEDAAKIYKKLKFLRQVAEKTKGKQSELVKDLSKIIEPIEAQMKKRASLGTFIREQATSFRRRLPESIAARIPVIGGVLSDFLRQKRTSKEELEKYSENIQEKISQGRIGGSRLSSIQGILRGGSGSGLSRREQEFETTRSTFPTKTLEAIYKDVAAIRKSVDKISKRSISGSSGEGLFDGMLSKLGNRFFGRRSRLGKLFRRAKIGGRRMLRGLKNLGARGLSRAKGLLGRGWSGAKGLFQRGVGAAGRIGSRALGAIGGIGSKILPASVMSAGKTAMGSVSSLGSSALKTAASLPASVMSAGKTAMGSVSSLGSSALKTAASVGSSAASATGGFFSSIWSGTKSLAGKVGEGLSSIKGLAGGISGLGKVVLGAIGPLLESFFAWQDIKSIKSDPNMSASDKKKEIGNRVGRAIGSVMGSVGASVALGPAGPLVTAAMDMAGVGPGAFGEWLTEQLGSEKMYDLASSVIPALQIDSAGESSGDIQPQVGVDGKLVAPATANTTVGKMVNQYNAESEALTEAQSMAAGMGTATPTASVSNSSVNTRVSNVTNNFNDDLRIRNNEATFKTMKISAMTL